MKQVADYAGLSAATVSRVINGSRPVREDLQTRVWEAVKKLNYRPNVAARFM
ncbi:MAG: LacI family DNA-binding transcriptional regulator, partial [Mesotoga sp.]